MLNRTTTRSMYRDLTLVFLVLGLMMRSHIGHAAAGSPDLWLSFQGTQKNVAEDASGNGNNGKIVGAKRVAGKFGQGIAIGEQSEFIEIDYELGPTGTIELWFKPNWNGKDAGSYRIFDASNAALFFCIGKGSQVGEREDELLFCFEDAPDTDFYFPVPAADVIVANKWVHLAATWDFKKDGFFYINAEEGAKASGFGAFGDFHPKPRIGFNNQFAYKIAAAGANGIIDEFAIYDKVLSANEIKTDMNELAFAVEPGGKLSIIWGKIKSER